MKKYIIALLILLTATVSFAETKALIVSDTAWGEIQSVKILNDHLEKGWEITRIERGAGSSKTSYWLVIIEKKAK